MKVQLKNILLNVIIEPLSKEELLLLKWKTESTGVSETKFNELCKILRSPNFDFNKVIICFF